MDWGSLFFKFSGRINRAKYWLATLIFSVVGIILFILGNVAESAAVQAVNSMIGIVITISGLAVAIKRLHDRNRSGWYLLVFYIVPSTLLAAAAITYFAMEDGALVATVLGFAAFAIGVWAFVELACLRGTVGPNAYGPDPIEPVMVRSPA